MAALKCVIGEVRAARETIKPPHLATPMQVGTQPLQLQGSINGVTLHCLDVVLEQMIKTILALIQSS